MQLTGRGPGYTCGVLAREMSRLGLEVTIVTPRARHFSVAPARVVQALPLWARVIPYRLAPSLKSFGVEQVERTFLKRLSAKDAPPNSAAYIFPDASVHVLEQLRRSGVPIFREMINCHRATAKRILDDAYERVGRPPDHGVTPTLVSIEHEALRLADFIFCPNDKVEESLLEHGIAHCKLMSTSYGWDPVRLRGSRKLLDPINGLTVVFVGSVSIRKGAHLLLDYWRRSGVSGRLVLAGSVEPVVVDLCGDLLSRQDIVLLNYVENIGDLYRSADVFAFPSLEEGGPQVTYEACGCGLPVITSPMGAGRIVRHGAEGLVLDPYDGDAWIAALRELAANREMRHAMGAAAADRANEFIWSKVADERRIHISTRLEGL